MQAWLESVAGPEYASALMWTIFALIGLLVLLILIRIVRGLTFGTFVAGGRNRKARLAVMDATAVDSHRRLVLVRRDDVEHLILIGGPTDVVVEQNIRLLPPVRRPAEEAAAAPQPAAPVPASVAAERPRPEPAPRPAPQAPAAPPRQPPPPAASAPVQQPSAPPAHVASSPPHAPAARPQPAPEPRFSSLTLSTSTPPRPAPAAAPASTVQPIRPAASVAPPVAPVSPAAATPPSPVSTAQPPRKHDLDDALLEELEVTLEREHRATPPASAAGGKAASPAERTLDDEMSKLLSDLAGKR